MICWPLTLLQHKWQGSFQTVHQRETSQDQVQGSSANQSAADQTHSYNADHRPGRLVQAITFDIVPRRPLRQPTSKVP